MVSYFMNCIPDNLRNINITFCCDFAGNKGQAGCNKSLAGNPAVFIFFNNGVQDGIRYCVGNLVRMPLCDGFRCKKELFFSHNNCVSFVCIDFQIIHFTRLEEGLRVRRTC